MKGAIFDTMPSLNSNPAKNKFLSACSSPSAAMPTACPSFMKIIRQFHDNFSHPTTAIAKTERNVNNYHNAPLALFRNNNTPWRIPHGRSETARAIRMISVRGAAALGLLCTFLSERIPRRRAVIVLRQTLPQRFGVGLGFGVV